MEWTDNIIASIQHLFPRQRGNVTIDYLSFFQALQEIRQDTPLLMDKAYEGAKCRAKVVECEMVPVVPPKSNRKEPWEYDKELYKERNVVERYFRNIKEFRRVFTRYDKLDETYWAFIAFASIAIFMKN